MLEDYLLTNAHWDRGGREPEGLPRAVYEPVFVAREDYLAASCAALERDWGTVGAYLAREVGFGDAELARLREVLLEP